MDIYNRTRKPEDTSFVYMWVNYTKNRMYIGYHKGLEDDGYVCSSSSIAFEEDFNNPKHEWERFIIFYGSASDCIEVEFTLLYSADIYSNQEMYYNMTASGGVIHTDEVKAKISAAHKGMKGKKQSPETRAKMSAAHKGKKQSPESVAKSVAARRGLKRSDETKARMSAAKEGKKHSKETIEKLVIAKRWVKPVTIGNVSYSTRVYACEVLNINYNFLNYRIKNPKFSDYYAAK